MRALMRDAVSIPGGIETLLQTSDRRNVSIYLPAVRALPEARQNRIRYKNLLREAERRLSTIGDASPKELLAPATALLDDGAFWARPGDGLAVLRSPDLEWHAWLPIDCPELVVVGDAFHVKPILSLINDRSRFDVLAIHGDDVHLYRGDRFAMEEKDLSDAVERIRDELALWDHEKEFQFHTGTPPRAGGRDAVFFGTGARDVDAKEEAQKFFRRVDGFVRERVGQNPPPLVLCGAEHLLPLYRQVSSHPCIAARDVTSNASNLDRHELHRRAWAAVESELDGERRDARRRFEELSGGGAGRATDRLDEALRGAANARVAVLFTALGAHRWGRFDRHGGRIMYTEHDDAGAQDLLDTAALETLRHGGRVFTLDPEEVPGTDGVAAIFRY